MMKLFLGSIVESFLGPNKNTKIVVDGKGIDYVQCPLSLFQKLNLKLPLYHLMEDTLYAHHKIYGCSTLSLIAMYYFWNEEFALLIENGCGINDIILFSRKSLDLLISSISIVALPTEKLFSFTKLEHAKQSSSSSINCYKSNLVKFNISYLKPKPNILDKTTLCNVPINILYSSRHFSPFESISSKNISKNISLKINQIKNEYLNDEILFSNEFKYEIHKLVQRFGRGDELLVQLISDAWFQQINKTKIFQFDIDGLIILPINISQMYSTITSGIIIKTNSSTLFTQNFNKSSNKALVINGDLCYDYVHLGLSKKISIVNKKTSKNLIPEKEKWQQDCFKILLKLEVNLLLVKGTIDEAIECFCFAHNIIVLSGIPWKTLKIICQTGNISPSTYLTDCDSNSVLSNISIQKWICDYELLHKDHYIQININFSEKAIHLQTLIVCHPNDSILALKEHQLHHLVSRLHLATKSDFILPGNAETEKWCFEYLQSLASSKCGNESQILNAMANGFHLYHEIVLKKLYFSNDKELIHALDDKDSKIQAWKSALSLTLMMLQCDAIITNNNDIIISQFPQT